MAVLTTKYIAHIHRLCKHALRQSTDPTFPSGSQLGYCLRQLFACINQVSQPSLLNLLQVSCILLSNYTHQNHLAAGALPQTLICPGLILSQTSSVLRKSNFAACRNFGSSQPKGEGEREDRSLTPKFTHLLWSMHIFG